MYHRAILFRAVFLSGLAISGFAHADEGRARIGHRSTSGWEQDQAVARPDGFTNTSSTLQKGRGNAVSVMQTGDGNTAEIRQFGRNNTGAIVQAGSGNTACLIQTGRNLDAAIRQSGDNQTSGLLQTRWGSSEIPVEVCETATTRRDVMGYVVRRPEPPVRGNGRGHR